MIYVITSSFGLYGEHYYTIEEEANIKVKELNEKYSGDLSISFYVKTLKKNK